MYLGRREIDDVITFSVTTHRFDTGAATDADSAPTYRVYEDETSTPIVTGTMALLDSSNTAGLYSEAITLSAANGYEVGKSYTIYITAAVNSVTGTTTRTLQVEDGLATPADIADEVETRAMTLTADYDPAKTAATQASVDVIDGIVDSILVDTAEIGAAGAGLTNINLPNQTMDIIGNITGNLSGSVGSVTGAVGSIASGGIVAASFAADSITAAKLAADVTTELQAGLATSAALATLQTSVDDLPTNAELATSQAAADDATLAAIAALNNLSAAQVNTEVDNALIDIHLDHLLAVTYDPVSKPGAADALLNELVESDAGVARYTANALEQAPTGGSAPSAADIADAVWEEDLSDHSGTVGSTAEALNAAGAAGDPWTTALPGAYGSGSAGKIIGDNINATISSRATQTSVDDIPTNAELATSQAAADDATLAAIAALNNLSAAQVNAEVDTAIADVGLTTTITGRIDAAVSTRATPAQVATELGTYDAPTKAELDAAVATLATAANLATLDTVADAILALLDDARGEPGQGAPPVSADMATKVDYLYKLLRNKITQNATTLSVFADDGTTVDHKATVSDDGTTYTRGELATGP